MCLGGTAKAACYAVKRLGLKLLITNIQEEAGIEVAKRSELRPLFMKLIFIFYVYTNVRISTVYTFIHLPLTSLNTNTS